MLISLAASSNNGNTSNNSSTAKTTQIQWLTFDEAVRQNKSQPKKIFIDLYTDWCTWCIKMEKATFEHPDIAEYINENFYPVKLDAETRRNILFQNNNYIYRPDAGKRGVHELAIFLTRGRLNYPSVVFLDETLKNPQPISGFQNPVSMDKLLKFFGEDYYKTLDWGIFKQIYESPLEGRSAINEADGSYDIKPINTPEPKANPAPKQNNIAKTPAKVNNTTTVAPKPAKEQSEAVEQETIEQKETKTKKTKTNRRNRKSKK